MFIIKGGISREIEEKNLQSYVNKGYAPVEVVNEHVEKVNEPVKIEKSLIKMTTAELEAKAIEIGVDISECKNNAERVHKIQNVLYPIEESGE